MIVAWVLGFFAGEDRSKPQGLAPVWSFLVYLVCIPGTLAALLVASTLFFSSGSLLDLNLVTTLVPIVSMIGTLMLISRKVEFAAIPGFERLSGLVTMLAVTFAVTLAVQKTRLWIIFGASIWVLGLIAVGVFLLLRWSVDRVRARSGP